MDAQKPLTNILCLRGYIGNEMKRSSHKITNIGSHFQQQAEKQFLKHVSVDCVIFGFHQNELKVLLLKWKDGGPWCLPGGFVKKNESLNDSAIRTLQERTGLNDIFLRQFYTFGDPKREKGKSKNNGAWLAERFITVGYYALVEYSTVKPSPDWLSEKCEWHGIQEVPQLLYDHNAILERALETLRLSLNDHPVGYNLLPPRFTMPELQRLYETILGRAIDRRNFQKKILSLGILTRLKERKTGVAHKAPFLYKFDKNKYDRALKEGLGKGF